MRKTQFPWAIIIILVVGYALGHALGLILAGLGLGIIYFSSLRFHPRMRHRACRGTGEHHSALFPWTHRKCGGCQGGRIIRLGAGRIGTGHIRNEHAQAKADRAAAREDHTWR